MFHQTIVFAAPMVLHFRFESIVDYLMDFSCILLFVVVDHDVVSCFQHVVPAVVALLIYVRATMPKAFHPLSLLVANWQSPISQSAGTRHMGQIPQPARLWAFYLNSNLLPALCCFDMIYT
jgi:hypothetical protein